MGYFTQDNTQIFWSKLMKYTIKKGDVNMPTRKKKIKTALCCRNYGKEIYKTFKRLFPSLNPVMWWKNSKPSTIRIRLGSVVVIKDNDQFGKCDILFTYISDTEWKIETVDWTCE